MRPPRAPKDGQPNRDGGIVAQLKLNFNFNWSLVFGQSTRRETEGKQTALTQFGVTGRITRSARSGPNRVVAVSRSGSRRSSSLIHARRANLSLCGSSVVSDS